MIPVAIQDGLEVDKSGWKGENSSWARTVEVGIKVCGIWKKEPGPGECPGSVFLFVTLTQRSCSRPWPSKSALCNEGLSSGALGLWSALLGRKVPGVQGTGPPRLCRRNLASPRLNSRHPTGPSPLPGPSRASCPDVASSERSSGWGLFAGLWTGAGPRGLGGSHMYTLSTVQGAGGLWRGGRLCGLGASGCFLGVIYHLLKETAPFCSLDYSTIKTLSTQILSRILSEGPFLTQLGFTGQHVTREAGPRAGLPLCRTQFSH